MKSSPNNVWENQSRRCQIKWLLWAIIAVLTLANPLLIAAKDDASVPRLLDASTVTREVVVAICAEPKLQNTRINIDSNFHQVRLSGSTPTEAQKQLAAAIAKRAAPGYAIVNNLRVVPPQSTLHRPQADAAAKMDVPAAFAIAKISEQMRHNAGVSSGSIFITAKGDSIVLSGTLPTIFELRRALDAAQRNAAGYRIINQLRVAPQSTLGRAAPLIINGQAEPMPIPTPLPRSFIEGTIVDARDKTPIANVEISAGSIENDSVGDAITDANGYYRVAVEAGGGFSLSARASGHTGRDYQELRVGAGGLRHDIFMLRRPLVKGMVRDASGRPLSGAILYFNSQDQALDSQDQVISDRNGAFASEALAVAFPDGRARFSVIVAHPRFSYIEKKFEVRAHYAASDEVSLDLKLPARATVIGRITKNGKPFPNAYFSVMTADGGLPFDEDIVNSNNTAPSTDAQGRFRLSLSAPDRYLIRVGGDDTLGDEIKVLLSPGQSVVANRDLKPFPYGTIAGRVTNMSGKPVQNAAIELWTPRTSEAIPVAYTDKNGYYRATKVVPFDNYYVVALLPQSQVSGGPHRPSVRVRAGQTTIVNLRGETVAPRARILWPASGAKASGKVTIRVRASDNDSLQFAVLRLRDDWLSQSEISNIDRNRSTDAKLKAYIMRRRDLSLHWDSRSVPNGRYTLHVDVYDASGNMSSRKVNLWIHNPPARNLNPR